MSGTRSPSPHKDLSGNKPAKFNNGWTREQEELMAGWADRASCYRWMHDKCEKIMAKNNLWITVPVIILSTLTGSANFIIGQVVGDDKTMQTYSQIGIGGVSIFTGILTTLGNFFRYAQSSESHRVAGISWGKFQRQIDVELKLHPKERIDCMDFLKICRAEFDRLIEQSPPIPDKVVLAFEKEFKDMTDLKKPDIAHGMEHTKIFVDKDTRLKQVAAEAAQFLMQKRKVWHRAMLPDVENHVSIRVTDLSGNIHQHFNERIAKLEALLEEKTKKPESHNKSYRFMRRASLDANPLTHGKHLRALSPPSQYPKANAGSSASSLISELPVLGEQRLPARRFLDLNAPSSPPFGGGANPPQTGQDKL